MNDYNQQTSTKHSTQILQKKKNETKQKHSSQNSMEHTLKMTTYQGTEVVSTNLRELK